MGVTFVVSERGLHLHGCETHRSEDAESALCAQARRPAEASGEAAARARRRARVLPPSRGRARPVRELDPRRAGARRLAPRHDRAGKAAHSRDAFPARLPPMAAKAATPWGPADLVEELTVRQQAGERRFASIVQLLETASGERLVRFAYSTDGTARRGPVTLRQRDIARLRAALAQHPALAEALGMPAG